MHHSALVSAYRNAHSIISIHLPPYYHNSQYVPKISASVDFLVETVPHDFSKELHFICQTMCVSSWRCQFSWFCLILFFLVEMKFLLLNAEIIYTSVFRSMYSMSNVVLPRGQRGQTICALCSKNDRIVNSVFYWEMSLFPSFLFKSLSFFLSFIPNHFRNMLGFNFYQFKNFSSGIYLFSGFYCPCIILSVKCWCESWQFPFIYIFHYIQFFFWKQNWTISL